MAPGEPGGPTSCDALERAHRLTRGPVAGLSGGLSAQPGPDPASEAPRTAVTAPTATPRTYPEMTYADHLRQDHRRRVLRPVPPDARPALPISPASRAVVDSAALGPPPGAVAYLPGRYHGSVPVIRRVDGGGRVLWDGLARLLGWEPGLALEASATAARHWVALRSAGRPHRPAERRLAHTDAKGRLVIPDAVRSYLGCDVGDEVVLRAQPTAGILQVAGASLLARALDLLERVDGA